MGGGVGENGLNYEGAGLKLMYKFLRKNSINLYGAATGWYLIGSEAPIHDFLAPRGKHSQGFSAALGAEFSNGSFVEFGVTNVDVISSLMIGVGKRYHF